MLKSIRKSAGSPFIKLLLVLLVLSFISFYGVNQIKGGCSKDAAAEVNGEYIGIEELIGNLKNSYEMYRKLGYFKSQDVDQEELMGRLKDMILENMIQNKLKIQEAKKLGLKVSDTELAAHIKGQFSDPQTKEFNDKYYDYYLKHYGMTSEQFEEAQRDMMLSSKLDEFIKSTAKVSETEVIEDYKLRNESINLAYAKFDPANFSRSIPAGTEKAWLDFYDKNKGTFKSDPERKIEYLYFNPADFIPKDQKADPETLRPINEKIGRELNSLKEEIKKDKKKSLAFFKGREKIHYGESGFFTQTGSIEGLADSPQIVQKAFSLLPDETSDIISGFFSKTSYVIRVKEIKDAATPPFEKVKDKVRDAYVRSLAEKKTSEAAQKFLDSASKSSDKFDEIAKQSGVNVVETGPFKRNPSGTIPVLGASQEAMNLGFSLSKDKPVISKSINVNGNFYVIKLKAREEADLLKFNAEKKSLMKIALEQRQNELMKDWMSSLRTGAKIKVYDIKEKLF